MTSGEFDTEDVPGFAAIALGAVSLTGIGTNSLYGYSLADQAFSLGGNSISYGALLVFLGAAWIAVTNEVGIDDYLGMATEGSDPQGRGELETAARIAGIGLLVIPVLMVFVPDFNSFVTGSDIAGTVAAVTIGAGAVFTAYGG